jgi:hypothetical protein
MADLSGYFFGVFLANLQMGVKVTCSLLKGHSEMQPPCVQGLAMDQIRQRRKDLRYRPQERTLARISTAPDILFHIVDISCGGLAFRYLGDSELNDLPAELDILFDDKFTLGKLPVQPVSDCSIDCGYIPMRRRSMRFTELTPWQKAELDHFLTNYTATALQ